jgi:hypothetical protein
VLIDAGMTPGSTGGSNVGPDGPTAIFNTEIRAGVQIRDLTIGGDVVSDQVRNPGSRRTRIVAGEDRQGNFTVGGNIDNFQITGSLIDSVVAASVNPDGDGTYDKPAGFVRIGTFGNFFVRNNFTAPPYDQTPPLITDDIVLPGAINLSFAPPFQTATPAPTARIPLPTQSTVLGGVISTQHGDESDFAGFFAADTRGVFVGQMPQFA